MAPIVNEFLGSHAAYPLPSTSFVAHHLSGRGYGIVFGMASTKITVTIDEAQVHQIRNLVEAGLAATVSGFVQHAIGVALDDVAEWEALLTRALEGTGGPMSDDEREWADEVLGVAADHCS